MRVSGGSEIARALRLQQQNSNLISRSLSRISSGLRVRSAADDAAGLGVSEKMRTRLGVYEIDARNAQTGISIAQTADGGLQSAHAILKRIRDITVWSANGSITDADRAHLQGEVDRLMNELDRINNATEYNTMSLFTGRLGASANEYSDNDNILVDGSTRILHRELAGEGLYTVEVLQGASFAQAAFEGRALDVGEASPAGSDPGSFYNMIGAHNEGYVDLSASIGDQVASVTAYADEQSGDSINEVVRRFNEALEEAGIDAHAIYQPAEAGTTIAVDSTGVLPEPLETTVPLAWENPEPTSWPLNEPKVYDPGNYYGFYTTVEINFTSASTFNVTVNDGAASIGAGSTGTNFYARGISFKIQPDADYAAGDQIVITPGAGYPRRSSVSGASTTGVASPYVRRDSTISDGNHTVAVTNTSTVTGLDFSQVRGTPVVTGTDTSGVEGQEMVTAVDTSGASGSGIVTTDISAANTLVTETFTLTLTGDNDGADVWSVTGGVSGAHDPYTVGTAYTTNPVAGQGGGLTIGIVPDANYVLGDTITIDVTDSAAPVPSFSVGPDFEISGNTITNETVTLELITDNDGADVWSVTGSVSGAHSPATAGSTYVSNEATGGKGLRFNLDQHADYGVGDTITIDTGLDAPATSWATNPSAQPVTNTLLTETFTLELINDADGADVWSVTGSVSGNHTDYVVDGTDYTSDEGSSGGGAGLIFQLDPHADYALGDTITIDTQYGREAGLDTDSSPVSVATNGTAYLLTDDSGNTLSVDFGGTITAGSDTVSVSTDLSVDATIDPDIAWSVDPHLLAANTVKVSETFILTMYEDNDGADKWTVVGTKSGTHADYTTGTTYVSDVGSNGFGDGLEFALDPDSKYHVGSELRLNVYVVRPTILIESRESGAAYALDATVNWDQTSSALDAHGTDEIVIDADHFEIDTDTVIYDNDGNPYNDLDLGSGSFSMQARSGNSYSVTVNSGDTIRDLLDAIDALGPFSASFDYGTKEITIRDASSGPANLAVTDQDGSYLAERLGIRQEVAGGTLNGFRISRVKDHLLQITDPDNNEVLVRASAGNRSGLFEGYRTTDSTVSTASSSDVRAGGSSTGAGGITGVQFELENKVIAAGTTFSIQVEKGTLIMQASPEQTSSGRHRLSVDSISSIALGLRDAGGSFDISSQRAAQRHLDSGRLDRAIDRISTNRGKLGAFQRSLEETLYVNRLQRDNLLSSEARIRDADLAAETRTAAIGNLLLQSGQAALAHLTMARSAILGLLR